MEELTFSPSRIKYIQQIKLTGNLRALFIDRMRTCILWSLWFHAYVPSENVSWRCRPNWASI